jgi:putative ABC transport system permease protein
MFLRILGESFARNPRRKLLAGAALALGMAVATATLAVALDVGDRLAREFRSLGANLLVTPQGDTLPLEIGGVDYRPVDDGAFLSETEVGKLRTIFWRLNIVGFSPFLEVPVDIARPGELLIPRWTAKTTLLGVWRRHSVTVPASGGETFVTGVELTHPWWRVEGKWFDEEAAEKHLPNASEACVVGAQLARRLGIRVGEQLNIRAGEETRRLRVTGLLTTGDAEEDAILVPLELVQQIAHRPGQFRRLLVSALTKPEDDFARRDPQKMTPTEYDRWYCTPYISAIAFQIKEVLPGTEVRTIRRVADGEGQILTRVSGLMWLVTLAALAASALAIAATSATTVLERRGEVALMKALGAGNRMVSSLFLAEQILLALVGGGIGYALGAGLANVVGRTVFGIAPEMRWTILPMILGIAAIVALAGSFVPLRRAARFAPAPILRGE